MVLDVVGLSQTQAQPSARPLTLDGIVQAQGLAPVNFSRWQRLLMTSFGKLPGELPSTVAAQYGAGTKLAYFPVQAERGYSAVELKLQTQSQVWLDDLALESDNVFAAATHDMWVELGTPATVVYEGPVQLKKGQAYFGSALILPQQAGGQLELTVTGLKRVPELKVLGTHTHEHIFSPDLVELGDGTTRYDIAKVGIATRGGIRLVPQQPLSIPVARLASFSCFIPNAR